ncbi:MAG: DUF4160 domain-containing protein [Planctomycetota bacterium]
MPEISRFLGIIISMYFDEHNPPHFHVQYNEYRASIDSYLCGKRKNFIEFNHSYKGRINYPILFMLSLPSRIK